MKIGHIFILGQIGSVYENSKVVEKGVELIDIVEQLSELDGDEEQIHFHINSPGGFVSVGEAIAELIQKTPNAHTIAEEMCASIATVIHLAAPLQNRFIQSNTKYIIHNPFLQGVTGDADQLSAMADDVKKVEEKLEKVYSKATGLGKTELSGLMKVETGLTPEQCIKLNFASKIVEPVAQQAVARIYNKEDMKNTKSFIDRIKAATKAFKESTEGGEGMTGQEVLNKQIELAKEAGNEELAKALAEREVKAAMIATDQGTIETPLMDIAVGDPVMMDGEPAPDGDYVITEGEIEVFMEGMAGEGTVIVAEGGFISEIKSAEGGEGGEGDDEAEAKIKKLEAKLKEEQEKNEKLEGDMKQIAEEVEAAAKLKSGWQPPKAVAQFRANGGGGEEGITKSSMKDRRAEYNKK